MESVGTPAMLIVPSFYSLLVFMRIVGAYGLFLERDVLLIGRGTLKVDSPHRAGGFEQDNKNRPADIYRSKALHLLNQIRGLL